MATVAKTYRLYIDGKWEGGKETMPVIDKSTGETIGRVPLADKAAVDRAIAAAHVAFPAWSRTPAHKRYQILSKACQLLEKHQEEIAAIICREAGKAWKYSFGEAARLVETFQYPGEQ